MFKSPQSLLVYYIFICHLKQFPHCFHYTRHACGGEYEVEKHYNTPFFLAAWEMQSQPWNTCRISYWNTQNSSAATSLNHPLSCHSFGELLGDFCSFSGNRWLQLCGCTDNHFLSQNQQHCWVGEPIGSCQGLLCLTGFSSPQKCYFWSKCLSPPIHKLILPCSLRRAISSKVS